MIVDWKIPDCLKRKVRIQDILKNLFGHCDCGEKLRQCEKDKIYYAKRIERLLKVLEKSVVLPDTEKFVNDIKEINPWKAIKKIGRYNMVTADKTYYVLPLNSWIRILSSIQSEVEKLLPKWRTDVSDCDDYALLMASFVAAAFAKPYYDKQVAFAITWSSSHAYNSFITSEGTWEIYEPQSNVIVGRLGETTGIYKTKKIWFMG